MLDGLVGLVDREVELGDDGAIHPWLAHVVSVLSALVARQEPNDDGDGDANQYRLGQKVAPIILLRIIKYAHFPNIFI